MGEEEKEKAEEAPITTVPVDRVAPTYPLGKWRAWSTVVGASLLQFSGVAQLSSFGVFQEFYQTSFLPSFSASDISWIGGIQLFLDLCLGLIAGKLYDAGYGRAVLLGGSLLFTFSFFMLSLTKPDQYYQVFLAQGLGMGIGLGFIFVPTFTLVSNHFRTNKALAMGIVAASAPLGGIVFPIMLNRLFHSSVGFAWGVRAAAFVVLGCSALGHCLISIPPQSHSHTAPHRYEGSALKHVPYLFTLVSGFLGTLGAYFPIFYVQLFAEAHNVGHQLPFYSLAILNLGSVLGRVIPNYLADRLGAINVFVPCIALNGFVGFAMFGCGHPAGLVLFCLIYGFFFGSTIGLYLPVVATMAPREADMGKVMGIASIPVGIASFVGPPIAGAIIGSHLVWWKASHSLRSF